MGGRTNKCLPNEDARFFAPRDADGHDGQDARSKSSQGRAGSLLSSSRSETMLTLPNIVAQSEAAGSSLSVATPQGVGELEGEVGGSKVSITSDFRSLLSVRSESSLPPFVPSSISRHSKARNARGGFYSFSPAAINSFR
eukprot:TRINITY_DN61165_c0_g1_i1.p1 TRINITY_DN61165_c0_g1~~TRINITY_DN61165_c0_g1_i1.p1  ORF type:complete len:140 (-),score=20.78 TRINITY_DN61165_c0_g1_i1:142-561(-)